MNTTATSGIVISPYMLGDAMAIALTVFVMLTALLITFIVLLFAVPKFRALFFPTEEKKNKRKKRKPDEQTSNGQADGSPTQKNKPAQKNRNRSHVPYIDSVPTVPLGSPAPAPNNNEDIMRRTNEAYITMNLGGSNRRSAAPKPAPAPAPSPNNSLDRIPTVVLPSSTTHDAPAQNSTPTEPAREAEPAKPTRRPRANATTAQNNTSPQNSTPAEPAREAEPAKPTRRPRANATAQNNTSPQNSTPAEPARTSAGRATRTAKTVPTAKPDK